MPPKERMRNSADTTAGSGKRSGGFSAAERAAMKERAQELQRGDKADGETAVLAKIAEMPEPDREVARRVHAIIRETAPDLLPKTWYGMPAYAKSGKVLCFFQGAYRFHTRYSMFGFTEEANLDDGSLWPVSFALRELTAAVEARLAALVRQAVR